MQTITVQVELLDAEYERWLNMTFAARDALQVSFIAAINIRANGYVPDVRPGSRVHESYKSRFEAAERVFRKIDTTPNRQQ